MVRGLDKFREYFKGYEDNYVIIGGTACDIIMNAAALTPRATKDIDIVLIVEALNKEFVSRFWSFIDDGKYGTKEKGEEERKHYRFKDPGSEDFPYQVELFSRVPDLIELNKEAHLTPIPAGEDLSSLSAILMNDDYYQLTVGLSVSELGLKRATSEALICLKAKAFLDLTLRKKKGENIPDKEIKKHKNDVFRMSLMLTDESSVELTAAVWKDMVDFVEAVRADLPGTDIFEALGAGKIDAQTLLDQLEKTYRLQSGRSYLEKKIDHIKKSLDKKDVATKKLDADVARALVTASIVPLIQELERNCEKLLDLFNDHDRQITMDIGGVGTQLATKNTNWDEIISAFGVVISKTGTALIRSLDYNYQLRGFKKNLTYNYMATWLQFQFNEYSYSMRLNQDYQSTRNYSYDAPLDKTEIDVIVGILIDKLLEQISEAGGIKTKP